MEQFFSYGRFDLMQSRTTVDTGQLGTSGLRAKFSYVHKQRDGYIDNELASSKNDPGAYNVDAVRAAVSFDNGGTVRANYAFDYNHRDSRSIPSQLGAVLPFMAGYLNASPQLGGEAPRISRSRLKHLRLDHDGKITDKVEGHTLMIEADLGDTTTVRSITGYRRWANNVRDTDLDGNANMVGFTVSPAILAPPMPSFPKASLRSVSTTAPTSGISINGHRKSILSARSGIAWNMCLVASISVKKRVKRIIRT